MTFLMKILQGLMLKHVYILLILTQFFRIFAMVGQGSQGFTYKCNNKLY
jgi:hypothetical protein